MEYILIVGLTSIASWFILRVIRKNARKGFSKTLYSQSDIHNIFKHNSIVEIVIYMENDEDFATSEIKSHIGKLFPKMLFRGIALYFWMYVLSQAIT